MRDTTLFTGPKNQHGMTRPRLPRAATESPSCGGQIVIIPLSRVSHVYGVDISLRCAIKSSRYYLPNNLPPWFGMIRRATRNPLTWMSATPTGYTRSKSRRQMNKSRVQLPAPVSRYCFHFLQTRLLSKLLQLKFAITSGHGALPKCPVDLHGRTPRLLSGETSQGVLNATYIPHRTRSEVFDQQSFSWASLKQLLYVNGTPL